MITKDEILASILHEFNVVKHLATKIPQGGEDYRPTPGQRSTIELMRYLAVVAIGSYRSYVDGNWDAWAGYAEAVKSMTIDEFPAAMDRQADELQALFAAKTDEEFATSIVQTPWREEMRLELAIMNTVLKWLVGYKMQLFLYVKSLGVEEMSTVQCWLGMDPAPRPARAEPEPA